MVKKIAMDMLATKVLHFGPTYSRTAMKSENQDKAQAPIKHLSSN